MNEKAKGITDGFGHSHVNELANRIRRYLVFLGEYLFLERPRGLDFTMRDIGLYQKSAGKYHGYSKTDENARKESQDNKNGFRIVSEAIFAAYKLFCDVFNKAHQDCSNLRVGLRCLYVAFKSYSRYIASC